MPCNNVGEVNSVIDKIIYYKKHNKMTKRILQAGGDSFTSDYVNEGEYANTQVMEKLPLYSTTQLWASTETLTKQNIADGFKSNIDFFDFCGHGSWGSIASHPPRDDENWVPEKTLISPYNGFLYYDYDVYFINNGKKFPVCVFKSCSGSKYSDHPQSIGWKTVSKNGGGGIASFGASGISFGATGTKIVDQTTGWMEVKSFEKFLSVKILGQVWGESITDYYNTFYAGLDKEDWKTLLEWTLMGDPTLAIQDGDDPGSKVTINQNIFLRILDNFPALQLVLRSLYLI
jgi:hypothetical protein